MNLCLVLGLDYSCLSCTLELASKLGGSPRPHKKRKAPYLLLIVLMWAEWGGGEAWERGTLSTRPCLLMPWISVAGGSVGPYLITEFDRALWASLLNQFIPKKGSPSDCGCWLWPCGEKSTKSPSFVWASVFNCGWNIRKPLESI